MTRHLLPKEAKPIPSFFRASIKLGKMTELDYYKHVLPYHMDKDFVEWIDYILNSFKGAIPRKELEAQKKIIEGLLK